MPDTITSRIAEELSIRENQVAATVDLLDSGATVPFIARYRKEATGSLDDTQLRHLSERLVYLRDLEDRRRTILESIGEQGKLNPELEKSILEADTKTRLEDLYLPYKPKRRTKGQIAIEAGLEPLANLLLAEPDRDPEAEAQAYVDTEKGIDDTKAALDGARYILMERFVEDATLLDSARTYLRENGLLYASVISGKEREGEKFQDYFEHSEAIGKVPSHRALAMFRGRREGILSLKVDVPVEEGQNHPLEGMIARTFGIEDKGRAADRWRRDVVRWTWRIKLQLHMETELLAELRERAEQAAIDVFAANLKDLLLAAPAGQRATIALDPGLRTGVKVAVIDNTGKVMDHGAIFPHAPQRRWDEAIAELAALAARYRVELVAIGNGTASRETDKLVGDLIKRHPELALQKVMVNEAGASVYSASEDAAREFPDLDVTIRGAVSIGRRLQDPLAELVKIDPKSIGVGQYQHDVSQVQLAKSLDVVIEDCVNSVGVEVNTASVALLRRVSGLSQLTAENIIAHRDSNGPFPNREALKSVPRLGDKTFEQAAGFLRIRGGDNPLDQSAVHPESYPVVQKMVADAGVPVQTLMSDRGSLSGLRAENYTSAEVGLPTVRDILAELEKPGRDPRPEFRTATFAEGVETLGDLKPGMVLEGTVTNVTHFGAFVDIGVHQDGLVHISAIADRFVKDPREVVKAGDIVRVKVMEIDIDRKRIGLSMRLNDDPASPAKSQPREKRAKAAGKRDRSETRQQQPAREGTMAALFKEALKNQ